MKNKTALVAIGGNALITSKQTSSAEHEHAAVCQSAKYVVDLIENGWRVVLTHGNGPQVGFILRRSELAQSEVPASPLDVAVAQTQGAIGYLFQNALHNELKQRGLPQMPVVAMVTQTQINQDDPAFKNPDKPIGAHMEKSVAEQLAAAQGWHIADDAGRGWRRVVASPQPLKIIESPVIRQLLDLGVLVIACGGGGIPVVRDDKGLLQCASAVIDKDRASALLAIELKADMLLIPTGVEKVATGFGTPQERWLDALDANEAEKLLQAGEFGVGSMAPKIEAILSYLQACPKGIGLITNPENMGRAMRGEAGTRIVGAS